MAREHSAMFWFFVYKESDIKATDPWNIHLIQKLKEVRLVKMRESTILHLKRRKEQTIEASDPLTVDLHVLLAKKENNE